jgi:predicted phosphodiesterase
MKQQELIQEYLKKFPKLGNLPLARVIYQESPALFKDVETVRSMVRYQRGASGDKNRKTLKDKTHQVPPNTLNTYNLPRSRSTKRKVFVLPKEANNILFISDLHVPYHDIPALTAAIKYGKEKKVNTIFINGDLIDFYPISRFTNVKRKSTLSEEIEATKKILAILRKEFPTAKIYFLHGNHDNRLEHFLATKAPELLGTAEFELEHLLELNKFGVQSFEDTTLVRIGKLTVTHGHLLIKGIFSPVNPARGAFLRAKDSIIISHVHNVSSHTEKTIKDKLISTYSTGCLCELNPDYNPFGNNFGHGFAHITVQEGGKYRVDNKRIIDGEIY